VFQDFHGGGGMPLSFQLKKMTVYTFRQYVWMDRGQIRRYFGDTVPDLREFSQRLAYKGAVLVKQWLVLKKTILIDDGSSDSD
jgi:hypothetical protein